MNMNLLNYILFITQVIGIIQEHFVNLSIKYNYNVTELTMNVKLFIQIKYNIITYVNTTFNIVYEKQGEKKIIIIIFRNIF